MKPVAETSNNNLTRNSDTYVSSGSNIKPNSEFTWITNAHLEAEQKFQLTYQICYRIKKSKFVFEVFTRSYKM